VHKKQQNIKTDNKKKVAKKTTKKRVVKMTNKAFEELSEEEIEIVKRKDWQINDGKIMDAFSTILIRTQKKPTYQQLSDESGLDISTIYRHFASMDFNKRFEEYRFGTGAVVANLFKQCVTGKNFKMMELWLKTFELPYITKRTDITTNGKEISVPVNNSKIKINTGDGEVEIEL